MNFTSKFAVGETVIIDGDTSIRAVVCAIIFYLHYMQYKVMWVHNGCNQEAWIDEFRLKAVTT